MIFKFTTKVFTLFAVGAALFFGLQFSDTADAGRVDRLTGKYNKATNTRTLKILADQYFFKPGKITVREGENLKFVFKVRASDMETIEIHGFSVPKLNRRWDLPVGDDPVVIDFGPAPKAGKYWYECDIFCGPEHPDMNGWLIVLPKK